MQPSTLQVERCLKVLRTATAKGGEPPMLTIAVVDHVPLEVLRRLTRVPALRLERLEQARQRLIAGDGPSAEDIADRLVGRLVCDRLR
jgi:hypothetical protein